MAYSDFTLAEAERRFGLDIVEAADFYAAVPEIAPGPVLSAVLPVYTPLAVAMGSEKIRSELVIAPILVEVRERLGRQVSLFSGADFNVAPAEGLDGACDFLLTRSRQNQFVEAPVVAVVEAERGDLQPGLGQCVAAMDAARIFNERDQRTVPRIYGAVTTGTLWRFLQLEGPAVTLDLHEYGIERIAKILGILVQMAGGDGEPVSVPSAAAG
jgi:hypothetical protein